MPISLTWIETVIVFLSVLSINMSNVPPNFNVIAQPIGLELQEYLNKTFYDQTVTPYTTSYADFYALMPTDNVSSIDVSGNVAFPRNGPSSNSDITRVSSTQFNLGPIGTYQVAFSVPIDISGQLVVTLNNTELPSTVVGRLAINTPIAGQVIVTTAVVNSVLTIRNPVGSLNALPVSAYAGGVIPVSAHLVITRLR